MSSATATDVMPPSQLLAVLQDDGTAHPPTCGIVELNESDVLCGRGGAALRHPGNQTYRRLVNLNKGLYTTCLKTEKLKISRSIVAAIREQKGRFLEKEKEGSWYDIGESAGGDYVVCNCCCREVRAFSHHVSFLSHAQATRKQLKRPPKHSEKASPNSGKRL
jgi:hypothetical protein